MDLHTAIQETQCALNLVLNNKFSEALDLLRPWWKDSMYHALGYSSILVMQATMTFEQRDIQTAMRTIKEALHTCQRSGVRGQGSGWGSVCLSGFCSQLTAGSLFPEEMHAELCYAECLLQKATLTFVQDENMISFIKGGIKIRTSYQIYKILRLLEFIGFSGNRRVGLSQLSEGSSVPSLRSVLCALTLLFYHTYVSLILGSGDGDLDEAEALLEPYRHKYPRGSIILFYSGRLAALQGNFDQAGALFHQCIDSQQQWKQIHHLCFWELMWNHTFLQEWKEAYQYAALLYSHSRWSKAIYLYQKAALLSMMSEEQVTETGEDVVELFRQVEGLKQRLAGKSIPTEKFAIRKSRRYKSSSPVPLVLPALEMMYVWNGFTIVGKRADCTEALLVTIETAEEKLRNHPEFYVDDSCLVQMLKGLCLKNLNRFLQAELCFTQVLSSESRIRYDHFLVPFTLYELGLLYKQQGDFTKAAAYMENAKNNYKDYSLESRLHFRIHAALNSLKGSPVRTP
uniref:Tetratricopeptide repeat protein 39B n=1 Tax=Salarias fasciatus TaxID=181472 RepID=A0A672FPN6_SALFA